MEPQTAPKQTLRQSIVEFVRFAFTVIVVVVLVRVFIAQPFVVSGISMVPTFQNSDYLIVDELSYRFHAPERGDVVVFRPPFNTKEFLIKRIIGVPGDTVHIQDGVVTITNAAHPDGTVLVEPYITKDTLAEDITTTVTEGNYFVMGDNRPVSYDSRKWNLLPKADITGRALFRLFPIKTAAVLPGKATIAN